MNQRECIGKPTTKDHGHDNRSVDRVAGNRNREDMRRLATSRIVALLSALSCLAYEAVRINGWLNRYARYGNENPSFYELAIEGWDTLSLALYFAMFAMVAVMASNRHNPRMRMSWFVISALSLLAICAQIPDAMAGRWAATNEFVWLVYVLGVPLPALCCIAYGLITRTRRSIARPGGLELNAAD